MLFRFIVILCIVGVAQSLNGQSDLKTELYHKLDSLVNLGIDSSAFPGAQILVRYKDSTIFHETWGYHTYDKIRKVARDHLYDLASITKVSSGLPVLMKLYGEGKINIDASIGKYFKPIKKGNKKYLRFRDVLAHRAGLIPYIVFWQNTFRKNGKYKCRTFKNKYSKKFNIKITDSLYLHNKYYKKMQRAIKKSKVQNTGEYVYSGLAFLLMPQMLEDVLENSFTSYLRDNIYTPVGVENLMYHPLRQIPPESIVPTEYDSVWRKQLIHGTVHDEAAAMLNGVSCNAGLFGDAESLSKLFQLYLNRGEWQGKQIISAKAVAEFTRYQYEKNRRGLGFDKPLLKYDEELAYVAKSASPSSFGHSGFTGTMVWADPEYDLVFVFLSNRVYPTRKNRNLYKLSLRPKMHQAVYDYVEALNFEK